MSRKVFFSCAQTILFAALFVFSFRIETVRAQTWIYIWFDGSISGTTDIQTLDKITYSFINNINGSIDVQRDNIIIEGNGYTLQGSGSGTGITIPQEDNVTIQNTHIKNFESGICYGYPNSHGAHTNYNSVSGNTIENNEYGIELQYSSNNRIDRNNITNNRYGIKLESSFNNTISRNNISANKDTGISLYLSSHNNIATNNLTANSICGINLDATPNNISGNVLTDNGLFFWHPYQNAVEDNVVNGKPLVYLEDTTDYSVGEAGQVILVNCSHIRVENLNLSSASVGLELYQTDNSVISSNNIRANGWWGIFLYSSSNNSINANDIAGNLRGMWIDSASNYNTIGGNNITSSRQGGLWIINDSSYNRVYHNNFIKNSQKADAMDLPNAWDDGYPSGGNYWSDYNGADMDYDGIGDTPYSMDENNADQYPLMGPFHSYNASLPDSSYIVDLVSNSTISDFAVGSSIEHPEDHAMTFYVIGESGTAGFCRLLIPTALLNGTFKVLLNSTKELPWKLLPGSNSTHRYLYFNYTHSTQLVMIIPEFPSFLFLPLFMIVTFLAVLVYGRKQRALPSYC